VSASNISYDWSNDWYIGNSSFMMSPFTIIMAFTSIVIKNSTYYRPDDRNVTNSSTTRTFAIVWRLMMRRFTGWRWWIVLTPAMMKGSSYIVYYWPNNR